MSLAISDSSKLAASPPPPNAQAKTSTLFCDPNADVTFISSDGVLFKLFSKYFAASSAGFCAPESTVMDQPVVTLSEPEEVLEVLFQFIHPPSELGQFHQPSMMDMEENLFFAVATAAEKYVVYGLMNMCVTRMRYELYETHPVEVLNHAGNHGYNDLADEAADRTISLSNPLEETLKGLTDPKVAVQWTKYYGHWLQIPKFVNNLLRNTNNVNCKALSDMTFEVLRNLTVNLMNTKMPLLKNKCGNDICDCHKGKWGELIQAKVAEIPKFSEVLSK